MIYYNHSILIRQALHKKNTQFNDRKDITFIEDFYFVARYPGDNFISVSKEDAKECFAIAEDIKTRITDFLKINDYCMECGAKLLSSGVCSDLNCSTIK